MFPMTIIRFCVLDRALYMAKIDVFPHNIIKAIQYLIIEILLVISTIFKSGVQFQTLLKMFILIKNY